MQLVNKNGKPVLLYDRHMPQTDDIASLVLKGHLLVEEMLFHVAYLNLPQPKYLEKAELPFYKLTLIVRAAIRDKSEHPCWGLISKLNAVRNKFAHKLDPPELQKHLDELFSLDETLPPATAITSDNESPNRLGNPERLRRVVQHCMEFLLSLDSRG